jgi:isopentenyl phosphate kinase
MDCTTENITTIAPMVLDVVLYKGKQYILTMDWDTSIAPVISGDITYDSKEDIFIITGDGSISLIGAAKIM